MLTILLAFSLFGGIIYLLDIPFKIKIKHSNSVEESLNIRRKLRTFRRFWSLLLIAAFSIVILVLDLYAGKTDSIGRDVGMVVSLASMGGLARLRGNVQANSKDEYLAKYKDKGFILYLRSFESDFYSKDHDKHSFEGDLIKALEEHRRNVCAIGMTKELDAPYGATRVYVSDESWQSDVKDLMQYAEAIFVLVSDRQSCVWEISQCAKILQKTCFIIDNSNTYNNIVTKLQNTIRFPEFEEILRKIADKTGDQGQGENDAVVELKEKIEKGSIKIGLMIHNDGFDVVPLNDMGEFTEEVLVMKGLLNKEQLSKRKTKEKEKQSELKKKKRLFKKAVLILVAVFVLFVAIAFIFEIYIPEWVPIIFVVALGALLIWRWWFVYNE